MALSIKQILSFLVLFLFLAAFPVFSQHGKPIDSQFIAIKDTTLVKEIEKLIQDEVNRELDTATKVKAYTENFFRKGFGYISLYIEDSSQGDTLAKYYISPSFVSIKKDAADEVYPPYYTYIGGRLVLVYVPTLERVADLHFSRKSKKRLRKRVDAFLEKPQDVTLYNMDGSVAFRDKNFRIDYFRFHDGRYVYILRDRPPIVVKE